MMRGGNIVSTEEYLEKQRVKTSGFRFNSGKELDKIRIIICAKMGSIWKDSKEL
jgi:hypothetical protein